jgi:hypothetical protein
MRRPSFLTLLLAVAACGRDVSAPTNWITIDLCQAYDWVAYLNEGGSWTRLTSNERLQSFPATEKLVLATVRLSGGALLTVDHLTAAQAVERPCFDFVSAGTPKLVRGSVAGLGPQFFPTLTISGKGSTAVHPDSLTFWWMAAPVPHDILGFRRPKPSNPWIVDRMIFRRGLDLTGVDTVPPLDFESAEAFAPAVNLVTIVNAPPGGVNAFSRFRSSTGLGELLSATFNDVTGAIAYSIPGDRLIDGDMHDLNIGGAGRGVTHYYRQPIDRTITIGPAMAIPTFTPVAPAPYLRVRAELAYQPEYGSSVSVHLTQNGSQHITLTATREYSGASSAVWSLTVPDLRGVDGFQTTWAPPPGAFGSSVYVSDQRADFFVTGPRDGETVRRADFYKPGPHSP